MTGEHLLLEEIEADVVEAVLGHRDLFENDLLLRIEFALRQD